MPSKKKSVTPYTDEVIAGQLELFGNAIRDGDAADWTALDSVALGALVRAVVAADAGLMIRSSEQRSSLAVGLFLGGPGRWVTCRDQREALAVLTEAMAVCERVVGLDVPVPVSGKGKAQRRR